jgi:hypothetical protein
VSVAIDHGGILQLVSPNENLVPHVLSVQNGGRATFDLGGGNYYTQATLDPSIIFNITGANSKWELVNGTGLIMGGVRVSVTSGGLLSVAGDVTVQNGSLTIDSGGTVTANALIVTNGGSLEFNNGTLGITGAAGLSLGPTTSYFGTNFSLGPNHTLNITNTTTIPVGSSLAVAGGTFNTGGLVVNGAFNFSSGTLGITGPAGLTVGVGGLFGSTLVLSSSQSLHVTNTITVNSGAYLGAAAGLSAGHLVNNGDLVVVNSAVDGPVVNNHAVTVVGNVNFNGLVSGPGGFFGPGTAHFNGGLAPGASPANVSFEGSLALADTNTLFIEIGGTTPGSQFDRLTIAGSAVLDGNLNLSLINGFTPIGGQQFTILTAGSIVNNGFVLTGSAASSFNLLVNSTSVILQAIGLPGDYNSNGVVDAADYVVWRKGLGTTYTQNDYDVWRAHFGQTAPGGGSGAGAIANAAVPEPATVLLLMFAAANWFLRRGRNA